MATEIPPLDMTEAVQGLVNLFLNMDGKSREMFIKLLVIKMEEEEVDLILQVVDMRNLSPNDLNNLSVEIDDIKIKQEPVLDYETESYNDQNTEGEKMDSSTSNKGLHSLFGQKDELNIDSKILKDEPNNFNLNNHTVTSTSEFKCSFCDQSFFNKTDFIKHKTTHPEYNGKKTFLCDICPKSFHSSARLKRHKDHIHNGIKPEKIFMCDLCSQSFYTCTDLNSHKNQHDGIKPFLCDECPFASFNKRHMKKHKLRCHTENKPKPENGPNIFICEICSTSYVTNEKLKRHIRDIHTRSKLLNCDQCSYETTETTALKRHKTIHTDERPFVCHICSKAFKLSQNMERHIKNVHLGEKRKRYSPNYKSTGEKNHLCDICSMSFSTRGTLTKHKQSIHEGIEYDCDQCEYKATDRGNLVRHKESVHEGIKYHCDQCGHTASTKGNLTQHLAVVHLGITHECSQCDHKASNKGNLIQHVEYVHESFQHDCKECDYTTFKKRSFLHHMTSHRKAQKLQNELIARYDGK